MGDWSCTVKIHLASTSSFALSCLKQGHSLPSAATECLVFLSLKERVQHLLSGDGNQAALRTCLITATHKHGCTLRICKLGVVIQDERCVFVRLFSHCRLAKLAPNTA